MTYPWERMQADMQLWGLAPKTQAVYLRAVHQLAEYYQKSRVDIDEEELRQFFLYLMTVKQVSRSTWLVTLSGVRFFTSTPFEKSGRP